MDNALKMVTACPLHDTASASSDTLHEYEHEHEHADDMDEPALGAASMMSGSPLSCQGVFKGQQGVEDEALEYTNEGDSLEYSSEGDPLGYSTDREQHLEHSTSTERTQRIGYDLSPLPSPSVQPPSSSSSTSTNTFVDHRSVPAHLSSSSEEGSPRGSNPPGVPFDVSGETDRDGSEQAHADPADDPDDLDLLQVTRGSSWHPRVSHGRHISVEAEAGIGESPLNNSVIKRRESVRRSRDAGRGRQSEQEEFDVILSDVQRFTGGADGGTQHSRVSSVTVSANRRSFHAQQDDAHMSPLLDLLADPPSTQRSHTRRKSKHAHDPAVGWHIKVNAWRTCGLSEDLEVPSVEGVDNQQRPQEFLNFSIPIGEIQRHLGQQRERLRAERDSFEGQQWARGERHRSVDEFYGQQWGRNSEHMNQVVDNQVFNQHTQHKGLPACAEHHRQAPLYKESDNALDDQRSFLHMDKNDLSSSPLTTHEADCCAVHGNPVHSSSFPPRATPPIIAFAPQQTPSQSAWQVAPNYCGHGPVRPPEDQARALSIQLQVHVEPSVDSRSQVQVPPLTLQSPIRNEHMTFSPVENDELVSLRGAVNLRTSRYSRLFAEEARNGDGQGETTADRGKRPVHLSINTDVPRPSLPEAEQDVSRTDVQSPPAPPPERADIGTSPIQGQGRWQGTGQAAAQLELSSLAHLAEQLTPTLATPAPPMSLTPQDIETTETRSPEEFNFNSIDRVRRRLLYLYPDLSRRSDARSATSSSVRRPNSRGPAAGSGGLNRQRSMKRQTSFDSDDDVALDIISRYETTTVIPTIYTEQRAGRWIVRGPAKCASFLVRDTTPHIADVWKIPIDTKSIVERKKLKSTIEMASTRVNVRCTECGGEKVEHTTSAATKVSPARWKSKDKKDDTDAAALPHCHLCQGYGAVEKVYVVVVTIRLATFLPVSLPCTHISGDKMEDVEYALSEEVDIAAKQTEIVQSAANQVGTQHRLDHGARLLMAKVAIERKGVMVVEVEGKRRFQIVDGGGKVTELKGPWVGAGEKSVDEQQQRPRRGSSANDKPLQASAGSIAVPPAPVPTTPQAKSTRPASHTILSVTPARPPPRVVSSPPSTLSTQSARMTPPAKATVTRVSSPPASRSPPAPAPTRSPGTTRSPSGPSRIPHPTRSPAPPTIQASPRQVVFQLTSPGRLNGNPTSPPPTTTTPTFSPTQPRHPPILAPQYSPASNLSMSPGIIPPKKEEVAPWLASSSSPRSIPSSIHSTSTASSASASASASVKSIAARRYRQDEDAMVKGLSGGSSDSTAKRSLSGVRAFLKRGSGG